MTKILTSSPRSLTDAKAFASRINAARVAGSPLRFLAVVINAPTTGFHVAELGFATGNGFAVVR
jgi:hypothetical protein